MIEFEHGVDFCFQEEILLGDTEKVFYSDLYNEIIISKAMGTRLLWNRVQENEEFYDEFPTVYELIGEF